MLKLTTPLKDTMTLDFFANHLKLKFNFCSKWLAKVYAIWMLKDVSKVSANSPCAGMNEIPQYPIKNAFNFVILCILRNWKKERYPFLVEYKSSNLHFAIAPHFHCSNCKRLGYQSAQLNIAGNRWWLLKKGLWFRRCIEIFWKLTFLCCNIQCGKPRFWKKLGSQR